MSISAINSGLATRYRPAAHAAANLKLQLRHADNAQLHSSPAANANSSAASPLRQDATLVEFRRIDRQVRAHEQAHARVGGAHTAAPQYTFQRGPDGQNYAIAGHVQIDISKVSGDPQATVEKMQIVQAAALAPMDPSAQDRRVAAQAQSQELSAKRELQQQDQQPASPRINLFA